MVAFREHPPVAARHDAELDHGRSLVPLATERGPGDVPFQRDAVDDSGAQTRGARRDAVGTVSTDEHVRCHGLTADPCRDAVAPELDVAHPRSEADVRSRGCRLLGEVRVEPTPLRHEDERRGMLSRELGRIAQPQAEPVDDMLDDG